MMSDVPVVISAGGESVKTTLGELQRLPAAIAQSDLVASIETARALFDAGDVENAFIVSSGAYDQAKAASGYARKVKASRALVDKARRLQAEALKVESICYVAMAEAVDEGQAKGEIAKAGRPKNVGHENVFTIEQVGLDRQQLHYARELRDAVQKEPEFIERFVDARVAEGHEPSRRSLRHAIGTRTASKEEKGHQLYETPIEAMRMLLALESFSAVVKEPAVGRGAIMRPLEAAGYDVIISDIVNRDIATQHGELQQVGDFLLTGADDSEGADIVTNPPYDDLANKFLAHALRVHKPGKMAALLNLNFQAGFDDPDRRYLMDENPPSRVYIFTRRLPMMHRDGWDGPTASSQMNTAFFVWERNADGSYGAGDGTWQSIRVDWKKYEGADALAPGESRHRAPLVFLEDEDFTRSTPRKSLDERLEEEFSRAMLWMKHMEPFDAVTLRRGIGVRPSVADALVDAFAANGLIERSQDGQWLPSGVGLQMIATVGAVEMTKQLRAGRRLDEVAA